MDISGCVASPPLAALPLSPPVPTGLGALLGLHLRQRYRAVRERTDMHLVLPGMLHRVRALTHHSALRFVAGVLFLCCESQCRLTSLALRPCSNPCRRCATCDGKESNPNKVDRCGSGTKATNNDPRYRTYNRDVPAGSEADWTKHNPWRAPGSAPVYDACGMAGGGPKWIPTQLSYIDTQFAVQGDLGSKVGDTVVDFGLCRSSFAAARASAATVWSKARYDLPCVIRLVLIVSGPPGKPNRRCLAGGLARGGQVVRPCKCGTLEMQPALLACLPAFCYGACVQLNMVVLHPFEIRRTMAEATSIGFARRTKN